MQRGCTERGIEGKGVQGGGPTCRPPGGQRLAVGPDGQGELGAGGAGGQGEQGEQQQGGAHGAGEPGEPGGRGRGGGAGRCLPPPLPPPLPGRRPRPRFIGGGMGKRELRALCKQRTANEAQAAAGRGDAPPPRSELPPPQEVPAHRAKGHLQPLSPCSERIRYLCPWVC